MAGYFQRKSLPPEAFKNLKDSSSIWVTYMQHCFILVTFKFAFSEDAFYVDSYT